MKVMKVFILSLMIFLLGCIKQKNLRNELDALVEVEHAFCRMAVEKVIRSAFLTYLDDAAIVFLPGPVKGKEIDILEFGRNPTMGNGRLCSTWQCRCRVRRGDKDNSV